MEAITAKLFLLSFRFNKVQQPIALNGSWLGEWKQNRPQSTESKKNDLVAAFPPLKYLLKSANAI